MTIAITGIFKVLRIIVDTGRSRLDRSVELLYKPSYSILVG